jgi:rubrerythrin
MAFTPREIITMAIGIEEAGFEFYTRSGGRFDDPSVKDVFDFLAREELAHREIFRSLLQQEDLDVEIPEGRSAYLTTIGDTRVFGGSKIDLDHILSGINRPQDAIKHAFNAEKDSLLFYGEMKELYPADRKTVSLLDRIIAEEKKHVITLVDLAEKIRLI